MRIVIRQNSIQNYGRLKIKIKVAVNVVSLILVITTTFYLLSSISVLQSIRAEVSNSFKIHNLSDSLSKNSTLSMLVLGNPHIINTESDKSSPPQPVVVNGTHALATTYVGNGTLDGVSVTDTGIAYLVSKGNDSLYTFGKGSIVSKGVMGTLFYTFQAVGHYHQDGKLYDTGILFGSNPTGNLSFLSNTVGIYKDWFDKSGNGMIKMWFWTG
ncbi:MAG: hypothetical protein ACTHJ2_00105 [Candidatus Nitrosocosmicus sp.]